ncbi:hypothetical protein POAR111328_00450 [Polynucleobacter arcticus]
MKNRHNLSEELYFLNHQFEQDLATFFGKFSGKRDQS